MTSRFISALVPSLVLCLACGSNDKSRRVKPFDAGQDAPLDASPGAGGLGAGGSSSGGTPGSAGGGGNLPEGGVTDATTAPDGSALDGAVGPVSANAGPDQSQVGGFEIRLDGSGSTGPSLVYSWTQISGSTVTLSDPTASSPTFVSPNVDATLVFELTVTSGTVTVTDRVSVTLTAFSPTPIVRSDNPFTPSYVGTEPDGLYAIHIASNVVYGGRSNGVIAHDISDPQNITFLGQINTGFGVTTDIDVVGNVAFVTARTSFMVLDVSDPAQMTVIASYPMGSQTPQDVEIIGDRAYVAAIRAPGADPGALFVFDVSAFITGSPPDAGTIPLVLVGRIPTPGSPMEVVVQGNLAYVAESNSSFPDRAGLTVIDLGASTDAGSPGQVLGNWQPATGELSNVVVIGSYAIVSDTQVEHNSNAADGFLRVVDVSNPSSPVEVTSLQVPTYYSPYDLLLDGNLLYVTSARATEVFDVSDFVSGVPSPAAPRSVALLGTDPHGNQAAISGGRLYVAGSSVMTHRNYRQVDLADLGAPGVFGRFRYGQPQEVSAQHVAVSGNFAYVAHALAVEIYDVRDPRMPRRVPGGVVAQAPYDLAVSGNRLHVARFLDGLSEWDISDFVAGSATPAAPVEVGSIDAPGSAYLSAIAGFGNFVVVSQGGDAARTGAQLYDTSNAALIAPPSGGASGLLAAASTSAPSRVVVDGTRAVVIERDAVRIVDLSNAASPAALGTIPFARAASGDLVGDRLYLVGRGVFGAETFARDGLVLFDVSNPASPREVASIPMASSAWVDVENGFAYVASYGDTDVAIVDLRVEWSPYVVGSYQSADQVPELVARGDIMYLAAFLAGFEVVKWTPAALGAATGAPAPGAILSYPLTWDADMADLLQDCAVSGGTCTVSSVDRATNQATVSWTLPTTPGDYELRAYVGNRTMTTSARVGVRVQ